MIAIAVALVLAGCVTERSLPPWPPPPPTPKLPDQVGTTLPSAEPDIPGRSRVRVSVEPLGRIPYDGVTAPLVSPDGSFILTQRGLAPWGVMLGLPSEPVGFVVPATKVEVFKVFPGSGTTPGRLDRQPWASLEQDGIMLGRSCSATHAIVERVTAETAFDGLRDLGRLDLATGAIDWLTFGPDRTPMRGIGAIELHDGTLVFASRDATPDGTPGQMVIVLHTRERTRVLREPGADLSLPIATPDQTRVACFACGNEAAVVFVDVTGSDDAPNITRRLPLGVRLDLAGAARAAAAIDATPMSDAGDAVVLLHPRTDRFTLLYASDGATTLLPRSTHAASLTTGGVLLGTDQSLDWHAFSTRGVPVPLVNGPSFPRALQRGAQPACMVFGKPVSGTEGHPVFEVRRVSWDQGKSRNP